MPVVATMTADELFDAAIEEGRRLIQIAGDPINRNGPPPTVMDNALGGLNDIFDFLEDQKKKEREQYLKDISGGFQ